MLVATISIVHVIVICLISHNNPGFQPCVEHSKGRLYWQPLLLIRKVQLKRKTDR